MKFVTDDYLSVDVGIEIAIKFGFGSRHIDDNGKEHFHGFEQDKVDEIINFGAKKNYFKIHLELGEWYYHPTKEGLSLLSSNNIERNES